MVSEDMKPALAPSVEVRQPVVMEGDCACGAHVKTVIPGDAAPFVLAMAHRQRLSGTVICDECEAKSDAEVRAEERAEARREHVEKRRRLSGVPKKWAGQSFADLDADGPRARALELAGEWASGSIGGLVLWGDVGRGKTAIAAAAADAMLARGKALRWLPVAELLMDLRMPFDSREYARAIRRIDAERGRAALVLDDLDKLKPSEHAAQPLYVAINGWIEADLPLLVTLNRDLDRLVEWMPETFGEAIASRLAGYCKVREVGGRDRRLG